MGAKDRGANETIMADLGYRPHAPAFNRPLE